MDAEIYGVEDLMNTINGKKPYYIRPPYGTWNNLISAAVAPYNYKYAVKWNLDIKGIFALFWDTSTNYFLNIAAITCII